MQHRRVRGRGAVPPAQQPERQLRLRSRRPAALKKGRASPAASAARQAAQQSPGVSQDPSSFALEGASSCARVMYRVHHWRHMEAWRAPAAKRRPGCLRVWHRWCVWRQMFCRQAGASARNGRSRHRCYQARPRSCAPQRRRARRASFAAASATQLCQAARAVEPAPAGHAAGKARRGVMCPPLLSAHTAHTRICTSYSASTAPALWKEDTPCAGLQRGRQGKDYVYYVYWSFFHTRLWVCSRYGANSRHAGYGDYKKKWLQRPVNRASKNQT